MSIIRNAKEFFGLTPMDEIAEDEYYDEPRPSRDTHADDFHDRGGRETRPAAAYEPRSYSYQRRASVVDVRLRSYTEAARVGEPFRDGDAVVFDISEMDRKEATRIVDFSAGICFALEGDMVKVGPRVFAVIPKGADVSLAELERAVGRR